MKKFIVLIFSSVIFLSGCSKSASKILEPKSIEASQKNIQATVTEKNEIIKTIAPEITTTTTPITTVEPTTTTEEPATTIESTSTTEPSTTIEPTSEVIVTKENVVSPSNTNLSNETKGWYFNRNPNHTPPTAQKEIDISKYNGYYLGNVEEKVVYLTFDQGYENGYTNKILDILKEKNVKATFFLLKSYIKNNNDIVKRMIEDGHVLANHSDTHPSLPSLSDEKVISEIEEVERYLKEQTGYTIDKFFRPPMGEYSERTLAITNDLGYKTIFWSFAYKDWLVDDQPTKEVAYETVMDNLHNGSIVLLHSVSSANTEALSDIIDSIKEQNYRFGSLYELGN